MIECFGTKKCLVMFTNKSDSENSSRPYSDDISCKVYLHISHYHHHHPIHSLTPRCKGAVTEDGDEDLTHFPGCRSELVGVNDDTLPRL